MGCFELIVKTIPYLHQTEQIELPPFMVMMLLPAGITAEDSCVELGSESMQALLAVDPLLLWFIGFVFAAPGN